MASESSPCRLCVPKAQARMMPRSWLAADAQGRAVRPSCSLPGVAQIEPLHSMAVVDPSRAGSQCAREGDENPVYWLCPASAY